MGSSKFIQHFRGYIVTFLLHVLLVRTFLKVLLLSNAEFFKLSRFELTDMGNVRPLMSQSDGWAFPGIRNALRHSHIVHPITKEFGSGEFVKL